MNRINRIVLVDDDEAVNEYHCIVMEDAGYKGHVECHLDAEDALERLRAPDAAPPDLILLDINMPRMSGFDFVEELARIEENSSRPVIVMLSTSRDPGDLERAGSQPRIAGILHKPLQKEDLRQVFERNFPSAS